MKYALLSLIIVLSSCEGGTSRIYPSDYTCTLEQIDLVDKEFSTCNKSNYDPGYCFAQAKKTLCTKIKAGE